MLWWKVLGGALALACLGAALISTRGLGLLFSRTSANGPVNVLLVSMDTTRKDHLSCYGYERETTPNLDELAEESLRFTHCVAVSNWTLPTHASMLTGLYPTTHGAHWWTVQESDARAVGRPGLLSSACSTLAETLQAAGYRTGGIVANHANLNKGFQFDQGFDHYDDQKPDPPARYRQAEEITSEAIAWLEPNSAGPFFLFLNYMDPHIPWNPPPPFNTRYHRSGLNVSGARSWNDHFFQDMEVRVMRERVALSPAIQELFHNPYDGGIAYMDDQLGRLFAWLRDRGLYDRTLIVVTADHGEAFGEHFVMGHNRTLYEPELAVPMIVKLPFSARTGVVETGVQHVDIMPTVLDVLGTPPPGQLQGQSMLAAVERPLVSEYHVCIREARLWQRFDQAAHAVYRGGLKLVEYSGGEHEVYDLGADPGETNDLASTGTVDVAMLREPLRTWSEATKPLDPAPPTSLSEELLDGLRELGYLQ